MADIQKILDDIKELKLLEVAELVKLMEEEFGVSAAAAPATITVAAALKPNSSSISLTSSATSNNFNSLISSSIF